MTALSQAAENEENPSLALAMYLYHLFLFDFSHRHRHASHMFFLNNVVLYYTMCI